VRLSSKTSMFAPQKGPEGLLYVRLSRASPTLRRIRHLHQTLMDSGHPRRFKVL